MQDFFENAEPRSVAMMLVGVVVLLAVLLLTYLLWPQVKMYRELSSSHAMLEQAVAGNDSLANRLRVIEAEVKDLSRQLHGDMAQLPARQMESFVIGRLQKVSWETEVELTPSVTRGAEPLVGSRGMRFRSCWPR